MHSSTGWLRVRRVRGPGCGPEISGQRDRPDRPDRLDLSFGDLAMVEFLRTVKTKKRGIRFMIASSLPIKEQKYYMPTANDYFDKADGKEALLTKVHKLLAPVPELTDRKEVEK